MTNTPVAPMPLEVGATLTFAGDPNPWTVCAVSEHFAVAIRPRRDSLGVVTDRPPLYSVLDWRNGIRGTTDDLFGDYFGDGTYSRTECTEMLRQFEVGEIAISSRNRVRIELAEVAP